MSGRSLAEFAHDEIFQPLGMTSSHFHEDHQMVVKNRAYSYRPVGPSFKLAPLNYANIGATSLFTTVEDLARWDENFYTGQVGGKALLGEMQLPGKLNNGRETDYASGLVIGIPRS